MLIIGKLSVLQIISCISRLLFTFIYFFLTLELPTYNKYLSIFLTNENNCSGTRKMNNYEQLCFDPNQSM